MNYGQHEGYTMDAPNRVVRLEKPEYLQSTLHPVTFTSYSKLPQLSDIPTLDAQQALLVSDIYYGLLGYEGNYFKFSDRYDSERLHDRIFGPDHNVAKHIDVSLKNVTKKLLRYGKMYSGLENFCVIYEAPVFGRANHRLCYEISIFLKSYRSCVSSFQENTPAGSWSLTAIDNAIQQEVADKLSLLYEITCSIHHETEERNPLFRTASNVDTCLTRDFAVNDPRFNTFLESIRNDIDSAGSYVGVSSDTNKLEVCKGGCVLRIIQSKIAQYNGDRVSFSFLSRTFEAISKDYIDVLNSWLSKGEVNDPFQEFLIKKNELPSNIFYSNMERYWEELYVIKTDGLIEFFSSKDMQIKLLSTGKFLNIFRSSIGRASLDGLPDSTFSAPAPAPIVSLYSKDLTHKINQYFARANKVLLKMFFKGYFFNDVLSTLHQTFLLKDSSRIDSFLDVSCHELSKDMKPASAKLVSTSFDIQFGRESIDDVCSQNKITDVLKGFTKFTVDDSNFYEIAEEIINIKSFDTEEAIKENEHASNAIKKFVSQSLQRGPLESRGLKSGTDSAGTEGSSDIKALNPVIEGVKIDVSLPFPLNLVIGESFIFEYQLIFRLQMILKFTSKLLDHTWKDISFSSVWNYKGHSRSTRKVIVRCRVLLFRMKGLLTELQSYLNFSIIEDNYAALRHTSEAFRKASETVEQFSEAAHANIQTNGIFPGMELRENVDSRWGTHDEAQFSMKQAFTGNDIFDQKISVSSHRQVPKSNAKERYNEVSDLNSQIGKYLNNILRDSMITNGMLLNSLKSLLSTVNQFTFTVTRLKKTFISMSPELLQEYKANYPDKFQKIDYNDVLMHNRLTGLNEVVTGFWTRFNDGLGELTNELNSLSGENPAFAVLQEIFAQV